MAAIVPTIRDVSPRGDGSSLLVTWTPVTQADTCNPVSFPDHPDKSLQCSGTFGSASVALNGSNDGTNYAGLNSPNSTVIAITAAGVKSVLENTLYVQPVATGGSGQTLAINMLVRMTNPMRT
jgi:hypothetical protein